MLFLILGCARNYYDSDSSDLQFSLMGADVVEIETEVDNTLSYRHRPDCQLQLSLSSLNFGDVDATIVLSGTVLENESEIILAPSVEGQNRSFWQESYSIPCRDKTYEITVALEGETEVLIEWSTSVQAMLVEPGDWGVVDFSNPRVALSTESIVLSHSGEN